LALTQDVTTNAPEGHMWHHDSLCEGWGHCDAFGADDIWTFITQEEIVILNRSIPANNTELQYLITG
jgi:hypothetical protein